MWKGINVVFVLVNYLSELTFCGKR